MLSFRGTFLCPEFYIDDSVDRNCCKELQQCFDLCYYSDTYPFNSEVGK